ncbi:MAG: DUF1015 domain-containing protein [Calditrichaeota bacterium]|nr:DUF1015 domain-containing protein [Calditrichota bacterium]
MITIKPFRGLRPKEDLAEKVASPPYDVLSSDEARQMAQINPISFLHVNKPEIDLPEDTDPYSEIVYQKGRENLYRFINEGTLVQDEKESLYIYRLTWKGHVQTGYFCLSAVDDYDAGRIKKHELTRADKEMDRTKLIDVMNAQVGPVFLLYQANQALDSHLEKASAEKPNVDFIAEDNVRHQLWVVQDEKEIKEIVEGFKSLDATFIADGHHRSASASNVCKQRRQKHPDYTGDESFNYFLSVIFPHNQLKILPYNRVVTDLNGLSTKEFFDKIKEKFNVQFFDDSVEISAEKNFGMFIDGRWFKLTAKDGTFNSKDILDSLDVNILMKNVLEPILGIHDPRTDKRIDFIGGIRGNEELERLVNSGKFKVAFSLFPTSVQTLIQVADNNLIMPPKSTWFEPKLRSGMVSYLL